MSNRAAMTSRVLRGHTGAMKTAISVPDEVFHRVERHAARLHLSRSEFYARAAARWADELENEDLTEQIDAALEAAGGEDRDVSRAFFHEAARRAFLHADDDRAAR